MGYVDGKTDTDLLLEEGDDTEDRERIMILKVRTHHHGNVHVHWVGFKCNNMCILWEPNALSNINSLSLTHTHTHHAVLLSGDENFNRQAADDSIGGQGAGL